MNSAALLALPVRSTEDVLSAVAQVWAAARDNGVEEAEALRLARLALDVAIQARAFSGTLELLRTADGRITIPTCGASNQLSGEEFARFCSVAAKEAAAARSTIRALETELEETNRGVLALYAELDDRADKLKRADELKSRFLSYASHELRTPLNGIVGLTRMLMGSKQRDGEEAKQIGFIRRAAEEMREMVNDLLDLAKVEAGKITVTPVEFGLDFVFGALRGIFRPLLQSDDVVLIFDDTSAVPSIFSDEAKVSQILRNFLSNAIKFTEHGEVRVWAAQEGDYVRISVLDTGIGISPEHITNIFDEFTQIDSALQRRTRGTGLGLPLCRKLAELLGGRVEVISELGQGSTFMLVLPHKYQASAGRPETRAAVTHLPAVTNLPKVLIIDDMELDRYVMIELLKRSGNFQIIIAEDGQAGLETAYRERPDFIFLDLTLPRIDGFNVLTALRGNVLTEKIPVAIVTGQSLTEEQTAQLLRGAIAVLTKDRLSDAVHLDLEFGSTPRVNVRAAAGEEDRQ